MEPLDVTQLRAFLAGDDTHLQQKQAEWGYLDGKVFADPFWYESHSEITDRNLIVRSRWRGQRAAFPLADIACVVNLSARLSRGPFSARMTVHAWLVDAGGRPLAEVPWGNTVNEQATGAGLPVRSPRPSVAREAFQTLRPERRLGR